MDFEFPSPETLIVWFAIAWAVGCFLRWLLLPLGRVIDGEIARLEARIQKLEERL
jgi:hypothetical protein